MGIGIYRDRIFPDENRTTCFGRVVAAATPDEKAGCIAEAHLRSTLRLLLVGFAGEPRYHPELQTQCAALAGREEQRKIASLCRILDKNPKKFHDILLEF